MQEDFLEVVLAVVAIVPGGGPKASRPLALELATAALPGRLAVGVGVKKQSVALSDSGKRVEQACRGRRKGVGGPRLLWAASGTLPGRQVRCNS